MDWTIAAVTFVATVAIVGALGYALLPGELGIIGRLSRLLDVSIPTPESGFKEKQKERIRETLTSVGKLVSPKAPSSQSQLMLARAGFRSPEVILTINGLRVLLPIGLVAIAFFSGLYRWSPVLILAFAALLGYVLP